MPKKSSRAAQKSEIATKPKSSKKADIEVDVGSALTFLLKATKGSFKELLRDLVPGSLKGQLEQAFSYAEGESDLVQSIIETKVDFYAAGFNVDVKPQNTNYKGTFQKRIRQVMRAHELRKIAEELVKDFCAVDNAILHWKVTGNNIDYVTTLKASRVDYEISVGHEILKVELSSDVIKRIRDALADPKKHAEVLAAFPAKYVDAVTKGLRIVTLSNDDGEYWIVRTKNRRFAGFARPSMYSVFWDVLLRDLLVGGDWAIAYFMKRVIELVKMGERAPQGYIGDPKVLYPTPTEIGKLKKQWQQIGDTLRIFGDHTLSVEYSFPDPKVMGSEKYAKVEERILRWGGVIDTMMTGAGDGFSQGTLGARRFVAQGKRVRSAVGEMIEGFILHESVSGALGIPADSDARCSWDEQNLKEPKQVLDELNAALTNGTLDVRSYNEGLGYDHDLIKSRKPEDQKEKKLWVPVFEPQQGMLSPGRPASGNPQPAPTTRPKPSKSKGTDAEGDDE